MDEATYCAIDEHTGTFKDHKSTIRRFDFEEQKEEILTPELLEERYEIYGGYEGQLIYEERKKEGSFVKMLDLETGEVTDFIDKTDRFLYGKLSGNVFVYMVREDGRSENYRVMELDLDTGEQKEIWKYSGDMATGYVRFAWSPEIKAFSICDFEENRRKTYQYLEGRELCADPRGKKLSRLSASGCEGRPDHHRIYCRHGSVSRHNVHRGFHGGEG